MTSSSTPPTRAPTEQAVRPVTLVVPEGIDDPARTSGGNTYDRRLGEALAVGGRRVQVREVRGDWPDAGRAGRERLARALADLDEDSLVVVDGLVASASADVLVPAASRLCLVVLVHLPLGLDPDRGGLTSRGRERAVLAAARAVVTPSRWARQWVSPGPRTSPRGAASCASGR
jgi:hypothetical protein